MTVSLASRSTLIDLAKVLAAQCIVLHHLAFYGPMSDVAAPLAPGLLAWLAQDARLAVQVFIVIGGFLAAQALTQRTQARALALPDAARLAARRFMRLARPYWAALVLAVAAAAVARVLMDHPATPDAPHWPQLLAHLFMLQDVLGHEGLSAGVWYVAIDLQLYLLLVGLAALAGWLGRGGAAARQRGFDALCVVLTVASLFAFNLDPTLDCWAVYFFGAYGLGVLAARVARQPAVLRAAGTLALLALVAAALAFHWRSRVAVAGVMACVLACGTLRAASWAASWAGLRVRLAWRAFDHGVVAPLARLSYAQFLVHYPVCLLVNAVVTAHWPDHAGLNALGVFYAWVLSIAAAGLFHHAVERGALFEAVSTLLGPRRWPGGAVRG